jgi:hypothetical protein
MTTLECVALRSPASMRRHAASACFVREATLEPARIGDIVVFAAIPDVRPARVTRPRYMCCVKQCEVSTQSVFDTGAVRVLRAAKYEAAMAKLHEEYPQDTGAAVFYAAMPHSHRA